MTHTRTDYGYRLMARYYDDFLTSHRAWTDPIRKTLLGETLSKAKTACDLACGTGKTAIELAGQGIRTYAVDISSTMCRIARKNAKSAGTSFKILCADMRTFRLPERVDAVLCEYVTVNYVTKKSDLNRFARAASRALNPGGMLYFDVNNRPVFQRFWPHPYLAEKDNVLFIMRGGYDAKHDVGWMVVDCFVHNRRRWRRLSEHTKQVCWTEEEIKHALEQAGFDQVCAIDAAQLWPAGIPAIPPGFITYYLARKAPISQPQIPK